MWCVTCRSDVAAEVEPETRRVHCAHCGGEIITPHSRTRSRTQQARDLLERWSRDRSPITAPVPVAAVVPEPASQSSVLPAAAPSGASSESDTTDSAVALPMTAPKFRIDSAHRPDVEPAATNPSAAADETSIAQVHGGNEQRVDAAHSIPAPHAAFPADPQSPPQKRPGKWVAAAGQSLAYTGVLGLMAGTCLVILGHYRGPETYAPTGWLITMAGQMLLFLGVVTLVSSGMEETTNTVADRIDHLGEKLLRIEEATVALRGAHFANTRSGQTDVSQPDNTSAEVVRQAS